MEEIQRKFIIGDEWIYFKIYSGPKMLEQLLIHPVYDIVSQVSTQSMISNFFFIRYQDRDGHHLRLRFRLKEPSMVGPLIHVFNKELGQSLSNKEIHNIQTDTYSRELERYGPFIGESEILFGASSWQVMANLRRTEELAAESEAPDERWLWGASLMDELLNGFGLSPLQKSKLYESYYSMYEKEFAVDKNSKEMLKQKYRQMKGQLFDPSCFPVNTGLLRDVPYLAQGEVDAAILGIKDRSTAVPLDLQGESDLTLLLKSLMHMHYNRLFPTKQRLHELVVYYIFGTFYKSFDIVSNQSRQKAQANA